MVKRTRERLLRLRQVTDEGEKAFWGNHVHELDDACLNTERSFESEVPLPIRADRPKRDVASG